MHFTIKYSVFALTLMIMSSEGAAQALIVEIPLSYYGAKGDGIADDTDLVQRALTYCSDKRITCTIPAGKRFLLKRPVFFWGDANLTGGGEYSSLVFDISASPYLLNIGISGRDELKAPFSGQISGITFEVVGGAEGRIIYFWRTDGAEIRDNIFKVGEYAYSATSSGNDNNWVKNSDRNCIRRNIVIADNIVIANGRELGSEGIGLADFDGATVERNHVIGVGDDPIGIHYSQRVAIKNNTVKSVDGRIFVSNSTDVEISSNRIERMRSQKDGRYYTGIALIYLGFETFESNNFSAPERANIHDNYLYYPPGAKDAGAAIYLYGPRNVTVQRNHIVNDSSLVNATGLHLLPARFSGRWDDRDGKDPSNVARVWRVNILENTSDGLYPLPIIMTGNCSEYAGPVVVEGNVARDYQFYCDNTKLLSNKKLGLAPGSADAATLPGAKSP